MISQADIIRLGVFQLPSSYRVTQQLIKMKFLVLAAILAVAAAADYIETLDDHFDFTKLDHAQLTTVAKCFMNQGPCNELMLSYKKHYPGLVIDACKRCNDAQKGISKVYFTRIANELPEVYHQVRKYMDPEDKYFDKFLAAIGM